MYMQGSDLVHAAHYEQRQEQAFHEAVAELHNKIVDHRQDRKACQQRALHERAAANDEYACLF